MYRAFQPSVPQPSSGRSTIMSSVLRAISKRPSTESFFSRYRQMPPTDDTSRNTPLVKGFPASQAGNLPLCRTASHVRPAAAATTHTTCPNQPGPPYTLPKPAFDATDSTAETLKGQGRQPTARPMGPDCQSCRSAERPHGCFPPDAGAAGVPVRPRTYPKDTPLRPDSPSSAAHSPLPADTFQQSRLASTTMWHLPEYSGGQTIVAEKPPL